MLQSKAEFTVPLWMTAAADIMHAQDQRCLASDSKRQAQNAASQGPKKCAKSAVQVASHVWHATDDHACRDRYGKCIDFSVCIAVASRTAQTSQYDKVVRQDFAHLCHTSSLQPQSQP